MYVQCVDSQCGDDQTVVSYTIQPSVYPRFSGIKEVLTREVTGVICYTLCEQLCELLQGKFRTNKNVPKLLGSCPPVLRVCGDQRTLSANAEHSDGSPAQASTLR